MKTLEFKTSQKYELLDVTSRVEKIVAKSGVKEGLCLVFVPHATAALILNENEERLKRDFVTLFKIIASFKNWEHNLIDDNAAAHLLSGIIGQSKTLPIKNGKIVRGTWQNILFVELDGPRAQRRVIVKIIKALSA